MANKQVDNVTINVAFNKDEPKEQIVTSGENLPDIVKKFDSYIRFLDSRTSKSDIILDATISTTWTGDEAPYSQTIEIEQVTANSVVEISPCHTNTTAQVEAYQSLNLQDGGQEAGKIHIKAFGVPNTIDIPIHILIRADVPTKV